MGVNGFHIDAHKAGSMVDNIDAAHLEMGMLRELRNARFDEGLWQTRYGWAKDNTTAMAWDYCCGIFAYRDTTGQQHILVVGDDGNLYRNNQDGDWDWVTPVTLNDAVVWDETYTACFAPWFDDCFICLGSTDGSVQNLRYDGRIGQAFGVSMGAPASTPVLAEDDGGGSLDAGSYRIAYTFYHTPDVGTSVESSYSPISDALAIGADDAIDITGISIYGGTGRTIHRRIYASVGSGAFTHVATIENNTATSVKLTTTANGDGSTYTPAPVIPVTKYVTMNADGIPVFLNDVENGEPATLYIAHDSTHIESVAVDLNTGTYANGGVQQAGSHDDPITAPKSIRDGVFIGKERSIHYLPRECQDCERLVTDVGVVAWATVQAHGSTIYFLTRNGPMKLDHRMPDDVAFVGPDPMRFALAEWWADVDKTNLAFASSVHIAERNEIRWFVQRCSDSGLHNDSVIVLNYDTNRVHVHDMLIDFACIVPVEGSAEDVAWGAFPGGFVGPLCDGLHGDGVDDYVAGYIVSQSGNIVTIDESSLTITGSGFAGSVLYVWDGTGNMLTTPCLRSKGLITKHAAGTMELSGEMTLDTTSRYWIGGFGNIIDMDGMDFDDPGGVATMEKTDIQLKV